MTKNQSISLLQKQFISFLFIVIITIGSTAHTGVLECEVGDLSRGYWYYNSLTSISDTCPDPGPPAADSPMPMFPLHQEVYRIAGRYKFRSYISADLSHSSPPPSKPECITGYVDAYAAYYADLSTGTCTATGSLVTCGELPGLTY